MTYGPPPTPGQQPPQPRNGDGAQPASMYGPQSPPHGGPTQPAATHGAQVPGQAQSATQYSGAQNQTGSNGPPPQQPGRDNRALLTEQEESYADPPRAWKRAGSLLGSWAVVWASILIAGLVFEGLVDASPDSVLDEDPVNPNQTALRVLTMTFADRDPEGANDYLCSESDPADTTALFEEMKDWEQERGVDANVEVTELGDSATGTDTFPMQVDLGAGNVFEEWRYNVTVEPDGSTFCVSKIEKDTTEE